MRLLCIYLSKCEILMRCSISLMRYNLKSANEKTSLWKSVLEFTNSETVGLYTSYKFISHQLIMIFHDIYPSTTLGKLLLQKRKISQPSYDQLLYIAQMDSQSIRNWGPFDTSTYWSAHWKTIQHIRKLLFMEYSHDITTGSLFCGKPFPSLSLFRR